MRDGQVFIAMHWGQEYLSGRGRGKEGSYGVNALTSPALDPVSKQPELKHAAVKILKAELPWHFVVFGWADENMALSLQSVLRAYMPRFAFASCTLFGRERTGVVFRAADDYAAAPELVAEIEAHFGIVGVNALRYDDKRRGNARHLRIEDGKLVAVSLSGDISAQGWLREYLENEQPVASLGRLLLMPSSKAPQGFKARGRIVCNCLNVSESEIEVALEEQSASDKRDAGIRLACLQKTLQCGTRCGSCVPELKKIIIAQESSLQSVA